MSRHDKLSTLVDTDLPEHSDGTEALAMSADCKAFLQDGTGPDWGLDG